VFFRLLSHLARPGSADDLGNRLHILNEALDLGAARLVVRGPQHGGGMHCSHHVAREGGGHKFASALADLEILAQQRLRGGCAQADDDFRTRDLDFRI